VQPPGVLGKNGAQIAVPAPRAVDRYRRVENPVGPHPGDSGWLWIFRGLFFIFLGIKPRHLLSRIWEFYRFVF
jgi:hypothetical protein